MYRNIMVPVDGSPFSREAVLHGLRIASLSGATLRLIRIGPSPAIHFGTDSADNENPRFRNTHSAELADLYTIAAECRAHSTVNVTAALHHGPVVDALIGYARRHQVDLIVMRSHGRTGLARAWFGSVADGLIRNSGIPVLVAGPPSVASSLEGGTTFNRILIPLDGSLLAEQSIEPAVALARINRSSICLLRVLAPARSHEHEGLESAIGPAPAADVAEAQRYLDSLLTSVLDQSIQVTRRVVISDDVVETILSAAKVMETDLIAIATRGRGTLARATTGSVADRVMREAPISTMVIHPAESKERSYFAGARPATSPLETALAHSATQA